jgi:hypothetical protein
MPEAPADGPAQSSGTITAAMREKAVIEAMATRREKREAASDPETLLQELADAAYGAGRWTKLAPDKRLAALVKLLEYKAVKASKAGPAQSDSDGPSNDIPTLVIE